MKYEKIVKAKFIERLNRFVAIVEVDDANPVKVHVKNTGRCKELLVPGATVYLEDHKGRMGNRKMRYSLIAVEKECTLADTLLINMDSQAPNKVVCEALASGKLRLPGFGAAHDGESDAANEQQRLRSQFSLIKPETTFGDSRFDFYVEGPAETAETSPAETATRPADGNATEQKAFIEVKGVTLENEGFARFPDAPTERGLKHIEELCRAVKEGYRAYIIFVIQMKKIHTFGPNYETHPEFGEALINAVKEGVQVLAYDCEVTPDTLALDRPVNIDLSR